MPDVEIMFWKNKANNLDSIFEQLLNTETWQVLDALDGAKSPFYVRFARICKEVHDAQLKADDNMKHIKTLEKLVNKLNEDDFVNISARFKPILHTTMLIWKHPT